jgi:hypothetical protein
MLLFPPLHPITQYGSQRRTFGFVHLCAAFPCIAVGDADPDRRRAPAATRLAPCPFRTKPRSAPVADSKSCAGIVALWPAQTLPDRPNSALVQTAAPHSRASAHGSAPGGTQNRNSAASVIPASGRGAPRKHHRSRHCQRALASVEMMI